MGAHVVMFSKDADADRAFIRDVLGFESVDAGHGWLIFGLPPAELGVHPGDEYQHELYLMCADIEATVKELQAKGVHFIRPIQNAGFGRMAAFQLPGGGELALYEPRHPTAIGAKP